MSLRLLSELHQVLLQLAQRGSIHLIPRYIGIDVPMYHAGNERTVLPCRTARKDAWSLFYLDSSFEGFHVFGKVMLSSHKQKAASISTRLTKTASLSFHDSSGAGQGTPPEDLLLSTMSQFLLPDHNDKVNNSNETPAATRSHISSKRIFGNLNPVTRRRINNQLRHYLHAGSSGYCPGAVSP